MLADTKICKVLGSLEHPSWRVKREGEFTLGTKRHPTEEATITEVTTTTTMGTTRDIRLQGAMDTTFQRWTHLLSMVQVHQRASKMS